MREIWADSFVEEANISRTIWMLRSALGHDENGQQYIETIPKHGYRFLANVVEISPAGPVNQNGATALVQNLEAETVKTNENYRVHAQTVVKPATTTTNQSVAPQTKKYRTILAVTLFPLLSAIIALSFYYSQKKNSPVRTPEIKSLAVLPIKNMSGDQAQDYLVDGMTAGLIANLSRIGNLRVIASKSVMAYKGSSRTLAEIASDLNVDAIVQGGFRADGDHFQIDLELVDGRTENKLWSHKIERSSGEVLNIQRDIADAIRSRLHIDAHPPATYLQNVNPEAYNLYQHGRYQLQEETKENALKAIAFQQQAVNLDPNFALAYTELARAYNIYTYFYEPKAKKSYENAFVAVETALNKDPDLGDAHFVRGLLLWTHAKGFPHEQVIAEYKRALELNPNLDEAHHQLGIVYHHIGLFDKALAEYQLALAINPANNIVRVRFGAVTALQHKYEEALSIMNTLPPDFIGVRFHKAWVLVHLNRLDQATAFVEQTLKSYPKDEGGMMASIQALIAAQLGDERKAEEKIRRTVEVGSGFGDFHHSAYDIAEAYAILKKPDKAMKWLESAANDGLPCYPAFDADPFLENLRQDPRFIEFMVKQKEIWETRMRTL
jgi:TolB-like protein/Tfp pilus assembly protein PilF